MLKKTAGLNKYLVRKTVEGKSIPVGKEVIEMM